MAASAAHGTAIAVCCRGNDGVDHVVILSSAVVSPRQSNLTAPSDALIIMDEEQEGSLLSLPLSGTRGPVRGIPFWSSSSSDSRSDHDCRRGEDGNVHVLGESVVCAATGFAPDVRHVMRVVARSESQNQHYLAKHSYRDAPVDVHSMVRDTLAERLRVAALSDGGRPLGVQCLVVGCGRRTPHHETTCWNLHVVDPTGHWRHYGGGATAIGKHASLIRTKLHSLLYGTAATTPSSNEMNTGGMTATTPIMEVSTPKDALDVAMQALLEATTTREELNKKEPSLSDRSYTALVLSRDRNNNNNNSHCTFAAFHPDCIRKSYTASLERAFLMTNNEQTA